MSIIIDDSTDQEGTSMKTPANSEHRPTVPHGFLIIGLRWVIPLLCFLVSLSGPLYAQDPPILDNKVYLPYIAQPCSSGLFLDSITHSHGWNTNFESKQTVGEAVNHFAHPVYNVHLRFDIYDTKTQQLIQTIDSSALLPETQPGQANPFSIDWSNSPNQHPSIHSELTVTCDPTSTETYAPITVLSKNIDNTSGDFMLITGMIRNDQPDTLGTLTVAVMVKENVAAAADHPIGPLLPGATQAYTITLSKLYSDFTDISVADLAVQAQGRVVPESQ